MKFPISFAESPDIIEHLTIHEKLGTGKATIYKVYSPYRDTYFALKLYSKDKTGSIKYHKEKLMIHLNHPNVIQTIPTKSHQHKFYAILTEYIMHGDFFDVVSKGHLDTDILVRTYFRQLIEGIEYIHSKGIAHLDLKLDNLMLGTGYLLKIIDFDQAQLVSENYLTSGGSRDYRAPEVLTGEGEDLAAVDIYSAGVILFAFKTQAFPFQEDEDSYQNYKLYIKNKSAYWRFLAQNKGNGFFSKDFIQLFNGMVHQDVKRRFTIEEIKESKWYKGTVLDPEELRAEMDDKIKIQFTLV